MATNEGACGMNNHLMATIAMVGRKHRLSYINNREGGLQTAAACLMGKETPAGGMGMG